MDIDTEEIGDNLASICGAMPHYDMIWLDEEFLFLYLLGINSSHCVVAVQCALVFCRYSKYTQNFECFRLVGAKIKPFDFQLIN